MIDFDWNTQTTVESSRDGVIWDRDAGYDYFLHGPLKRIELGEDRLQGLDYTHTIQGWLKAINHPALSIDTTIDPGHDNGMVRTAPDVFGMILNYYEGDYLRSYNSGADQSPYNSKSVGSSSQQAYQLASGNLYNGNISGWSLRTTPVGLPSIPAGQTAAALYTHEHLVGYSFRYDVLNRLRTSSFAYYSQGSSSAWNYMGTADYYMSLAYDPNGNIDSMTRHGYAKPGGNVAMDKLTYSYPTTPGSENNRLRHVKDSESSGYYANDIDDEPDDNYLYDPSGNLIYDQSEGTLIRWNAQGKVTQVRKITATVKKDLIYIYDGAGERIAKKELDYLASGDSSWVTYYVRDAGEKVIAVYRQKYHYDSTEILCPPGVPGSGSDSDADGFDETPPNICDNCNSTESPSLPPEYSRRNPWQEDYDNDGIGDACDPCPFGPGDECGTPLSDTAVVKMSKWIPSGFAVLAEWHIYGSSVQGRVGIWKPEKNRDTSLVSDTIFTRILTMKEYELKDHLGNVTVVISDLKTASTGGGAPFGVDVKSFSHYYPFGMLQPGAFGSNREYRFGFNGKESDNDWKGEGNVYDYGFRVYDPRIAKFLSVDPLAPEYPSHSPYGFAMNRPIDGVDIDGLEWSHPIITPAGETSEIPFAATSLEYVGADGVISLGPLGNPSGRTIGVPGSVQGFTYNGIYYGAGFSGFGQVFEGYYSLRDGKSEKFIMAPPSDFHEAHKRRWQYALYNIRHSYGDPVGMMGAYTQISVYRIWDMLYMFTQQLTLSEHGPIVNSFGEYATPEEVYDNNLAMGVAIGLSIGGDLVNGSVPAGTVSTIDAGSSATLAESSGSLTASQIIKIQRFADKYQVRVDVVGSRAAGTATEISDFDYVIGGNSKIRAMARRELPRGESGGELNSNGQASGIDIFNAHKEPLNPSKPHITFTPKPRQ